MRTPGVVAVYMCSIRPLDCVGFPLQGADSLLSLSISLSSVFLCHMVWLKWAPYDFGDTYPGFIIFIKLQGTELSPVIFANNFVEAGPSIQL